MKELLRLITVFVVAGLIPTACRPEAQPSPTPAAKVEPLAPKSGWEQEWDSALREAKKEGVVTISTTWRPETRIALTEAFKDKYGINLEFSPAGRGAELMAKVRAENVAGLYLHDFFGIGSGTALTMLKPAGLLGPLEPLLIMPEIKDPKYWRGGELPFLDKDKLFLALLAQKQIYIIYNNQLVKKGEIASYKDLLKPQYKGKIVLNDPSTQGSGNGMMTLLAHKIWDVEEAKDYLRRLIKQQEAVIQRDNRLGVESVARGKFAIGLGTSSENINEFLKVGAPIDVVLVPEGHKVSGGAGGIAASTKFAHPNAAKVFLNWLLTKEGLTVFSLSAGVLSWRTDVPTGGINPLFLFQPGEKLFMDSEELNLQQGKMEEIAKQIIEDSMK